MSQAQPMPSSAQSPQAAHQMNVQSMFAMIINMAASTLAFTKAAPFKLGEWKGAGLIIQEKREDAQTIDINDLSRPAFFIAVLRRSKQPTNDINALLQDYTNKVKADINVITELYQVAMKHLANPTPASVVFLFIEGMKSLLGKEKPETVEYPVNGDLLAPDGSVYRTLANGLLVAIDDDLTFAVFPLNKSADHVVAQLHAQLTSMQ